MIHAYDEAYLSNAQASMGIMLDFATGEMGLTLEEFFPLFAQSDIAARFCDGDFTLIAGKSGVELAYAVLDEAKRTYRRVKPRYAANRSREYWTGWALAYYQWWSALSFADILQFVSISDVRAMYSPFHEMDVRQFADRMDELRRTSRTGVGLRAARRRAGLSQGKLALLAGVPVRTIQQYEQRQKDIGKANVEAVIKLAKVLKCSVEELVDG